MSGEEATDQNHANVAMEESGEFLVAWQEALDGETWITSRVFHADGQPRRLPELASSVDEIESNHPQVHVDEVGFVLGWRERTDEVVRVRRYSGSGLWNGDQEAIDPPATYADYVDHDTLSGGTAVVVAWLQEDLLQVQVGLQMLSLDLKAETDAITLSSGRPGAVVDGPVAVVAVGATRAAVTWSEVEGEVGSVWFALVRDDGVPIGDPVQVDQASAGLSRSEVAGDDERLVVVWREQTEDREGLGAWRQRFDLDGAPLEDRVAIDFSGTGNRPMVVSTDDVFVVGWEEEDGDAIGVYLQAFSLVDGQPVSSRARANHYVIDQQKRADLALRRIDGELRGVITWESVDQDGYRRGIYGRTFFLPGL
jgi:hypothetical protein